MTSPNQRSAHPDPESDPNPDPVVPQVVPSPGPPSGPTGPRTPEGKARSSMNALRHGLYSSMSLLPTEDPEFHDLFISGFVESLQPGTKSEWIMAHSLADLAWRHRRAAHAEAEVYKPDAFPLPANSRRTGQSPSSPIPPDASPGAVYLHRLRTDGDPFRGLSRHAERLHREFLREFAAYHTAQKIRLDREAAQACEAPNPYLGRRDKHGFTISPFSTVRGHRQLWELEVELGLHDWDGHLPGSAEYDPNQPSPFAEFVSRD